MTEKGTLILRRDSLPPMRPNTETRQFQSPYHSPSLMPFAIDLRDDFVDEEDHLPPARNSDALGLRLPTMEIESGSTSRASFFAGLSAGLTAFAVAGAIAFVAFTNDYASHAAPRTGRTVVRGHASLSVAEPDMAVLKAPKKRVKKVVRVVDSTEQAAPETPDLPSDE